MNKEQFEYYIKNPKEIPKDDIWRLEEFVSKKPYCQIGHVFLAKIAHDLDNDDKTLKLNHAALYTSNRAVLKMIIEKGWDELPEFAELPLIQSDQSTNTGEEKVTFDDLARNETEPGDTSSAQQEPQEEKTVLDSEDRDEAQVSTKNMSIEQETFVPEAQHPDVANQLIENIEESRQMRKKFQNLDDTDPEPNILQESNNNGAETEVIFHGEESEEEEPEDLRKRKQNEIIDKFISVESTLVRRKLKIPEEPTTPQKDLSLKSSSLNDDLVSENLALIMKDQGKIDKAIDIYKKLIWKFPQKKAYFASLIEELKK